jgi:hypothetical protein
MSPHRSVTTVFSVALVVLGAAILVRTVAAGGGPLATGVLFGVLFCAAGAARLYLAREGAPDDDGGGRDG